MPARVAWLLVSPIRGTALAYRDELRLESWGVAENRRFYLVDDDGRRYTLSRDGALARAAARYEPETERLEVRIDGNGPIDGAVELAEPVETEFFGGRRVTGRVVRGPWSDAFSDLGGRRLRLVKLDRPGQAHTPQTATTILSEESLAELERRAGRPVDPRRFRMLIGIAGVEAAHAEDEWVGRRVRVGDAVLEGTDFDARCMIPTRDPDSGEVDLDALRLIKDYRGLRNGDVDFGIYASVVEPGRVRVGDAVAAI